MHLQMAYAHIVCYFHVYILRIDANSIAPDQNAPIGAV